MTDPVSKPPRNTARRRVIRLAIAVAAASSGLLCGYLPEEYQLPCRAAAKLVSFVIGGR